MNYSIQKNKRREEEEMIKRNNLEEQLREYQIRSKNDWASVSFFASTSNLTSRHDVAISVLWGLVILAILVLSAALLYFTYTLLAVYFICFIMVLFVGLKVMKRANISKKGGEECCCHCQFKRVTDMDLQRR